MIDINYYQLISIIGLSIYYDWFYSYESTEEIRPFPSCSERLLANRPHHDACHLCTRLRIDRI